jgi:hypothetical protein
MCSPAAIISSDVRITRVSTQQYKFGAVRASLSLREKFSRWLLGWKQALIGELAALGSPKEGFR